MFLAFYTHQPASCILLLWPPSPLAANTSCSIQRPPGESPRAPENHVRMRRGSAALARTERACTAPPAAAHKLYVDVVAAGLPRPQQLQQDPAPGPAHSTFGPADRSGLARLVLDACWQHAAFPQETCTASQNASDCEDSGWCRLMNSAWLGHRRS